VEGDLRMITTLGTFVAMRTVPNWMRVGAATLAAGALIGGLAACGSGGTSASDRPTVVVTTSILGDVVRNLVGHDVDVEVVMPPGSDPHEFAASARQVTAMRAADILVINGLGFEAGLQDTIDAAAHDGVTLVTAADAIDPLPLAGDEGLDPHFFTDPVRVRTAARHIADELAMDIDGLDTAAYRERVDDYLAELAALDQEVAATLASVPAERRVLVTNHEVFAYFADRYAFEVLGTVIPSGSTLAEPSASGLGDLADAIARAGVPAIFVETSSPKRLAEALAAEGTGVEVVELYSESLGEPGSEGATYIDMVRTNAERIAAALS
jgi:zinc/manganese transport system substrate-binding protein